MTHSNLTLQQLSRYLHLPDMQVRKLVDKGAIPSRRVNGELIFSRDDVHRWLEQRIGVSDEEELAKVEENLSKTIPPGTIEPELSLASLIPQGAVVLPLTARTRDSAIRSMVQTAVSTGLLWDGEAMGEAVKIREELHTTALDNGVALLHPRRPMPHILGDSFIALGIAPSGIPFGGGTSVLTDVFFLICSMDDRIHLRILTRLSRTLTMPDFLRRLRELPDEQSVRNLFLEMKQLTK
ncbi:MAG: PTS sugar transporter subunit IIA [Planctomycetaceae bacterium]|jgi:PTS system nitrogen regulatory IIA component|nr:PTS sugar transporter subunit IIA [Planctomycetaceae bacterium]